MKPITPAEIVDAKANRLPDYVVEAFNELIAEKWDGQCSHIKLKEASSRIRIKARLTEKLTNEEVNRRMDDEHWLDVEPIFREAGWSVKYDQPGYCESYDAYYEFSKKKV